MSKPFVVAVVTCLCAIACAGPLENQPVCPEAKSVRCLTEMSCQFDEKRACEVCHCKEPAYTPLEK